MNVKTRGGDAVAFTAEHALELIERKTYRHYLMAYDPVCFYDRTERKRVAEAFIEGVRVKKPEIFEEYDQTSYMLHDILQLVFINVLRDIHASISEGPAERSRREFQMRLLTYFASRIRTPEIDIARLDEFSAYCQEHHAQWLDGFVPTEFHMGGYRWDVDILQKWREFALSEKRP